MLSSAAAYICNISNKVIRYLLESTNKMLSSAAAYIISVTKDSCGYDNHICGVEKSFFRYFLQELAALLRSLPPPFFLQAPASLSGSGSCYKSKNLYFII